jgi:hypothetical protein
MKRLVDCLLNTLFTLPVYQRPIGIVSVIAVLFFLLFKFGRAPTEPFGHFGSENLYGKKFQIHH